MVLKRDDAAHIVFELLIGLSAGIFHIDIGEPSSSMPATADDCSAYDDGALPRRAGALARLWCCIFLGFSESHHGAERSQPTTGYHALLFVMPQFARASLVIKLDDAAHSVYEFPIGFSAGYIECYACLAGMFSCLFLISFILGLSATLIVRSIQVGLLLLLFQERSLLIF